GMNTQIRGNLGGVIDGTFKKDDVTGELDDNDWDDGDDYNGFTIYTKQESQGIAIKNNTAVFARVGYFSNSDIKPSDILETFIDTKKGKEDRYVKEEEDFKALTGKLGNGTFISGGTHEETDDTNAERGQFEGEVAAGSNISVSGKTTKIKVAKLFSDKGQIDMGDVQDWTDTDTFDKYDDVSSSKSGRAVFVKGKIDTDEFNTD
ncbi:MAG: hypothetical protein ABEI77_08450, partial [Halorientalis sp.]